MTRVSISFRLFYVVCCVTGLAFAKSTDYCKLPCKGVSSKNSGCDCDVGKNCSSEFKPMALNADERNFMLGNHNKYRKKVSRGNEVLLWHVTVANMMALRYDDQLEHVAMCWAKMCQPGEDKCRRTARFDSVGQNSYTTQRQCKGFETLFNAVKEWYTNCIQRGECFKESGFNQLIWAKTSHVGCARVVLAANVCRIICNYGPREAYKPKAVFESGPTGSNCPNYTKHENGLCEPTGDVRSDSSNLVDMRAIRLALSFFLIITANL